MISRLVKYITAQLLRVFWVKDIQGREYIPKTGQFLIVANHASFLDFFIIPYAIFASGRNDCVYFLAAKELLLNPILIFYRLLGIVRCIPIDRKNPGVKFYKEAIKVLNQGKILVVFPEGTRTVNGMMGPWKPAYLTLALRSRSPIIPMALDSTHKILPKGKLLPKLTKCVVRIGKPFQPNNIVVQGKTAKEILSCSELIRNEILSLLGKSE